MANAPHVSVTTTLPYVNADPHIGFAREIVYADIYARHARLRGAEVFFNTGTDEHGQKIYQKAQEAGKETQAYADEYAARFEKLKEALNLSYTNFIRTTDTHHKAAAQEFWRRCAASGDIYKKNYETKYCVGCELEKTDSELEGGKCPIHPNLEIEIRNEENYFFRFSKYQEALSALYTERPDFVIPEFRFREIQSFVARGLEDFSISRLKEKMPWGVSVPDDPDHVMYVWFDALVNYISTLGWPDESYATWWPIVQFAGKDNLRQQSAMWQAMLMSAGITPSKNIVILGFFTAEGQKMSKSLGNTVSPFDLVSEYGTDAVRYYFARHAHPFEDTDFSRANFKEVYNAHLVNGIGNLTSRIMKMAEAHLEGPVSIEDAPLPVPFEAAMIEFNYQKAMDYIFEIVGELDRHIAAEKPFALVKTDPEAAKADIEKLVRNLYIIAHLLTPFMPETAEKITMAIKENKKPENLFPRKE